MGGKEIKDLRCRRGRGHPQDLGASGVRVSTEAVAKSWHWVSGSDLIGEEPLGVDQGGRGQGWVSDIGFAVASG